MQQKIKPYIKCLIFIAGLIVIVALSDFFFAKTGYINYIIRQADSKENNENVWLRNYEAVKEYYKKHENLDIPYTYTHIFSDGTSINLGVWFKKQI